MVTRLQWSHRLSAMETWPRGISTARTEASFNGASAFRRWKLGFPRPQIQRAYRPSFNGATAFRRWKPLHRLGRRLITIAPSMGPPPFGDGNPCTAWAVALSPSPLRWGHRLSAMETPAPPGPSPYHHRPFDGATAFRRWKQAAAKAAPADRMDLQWGHRLSAMETATRQPHPKSSSCAFNGATAFRRWKHGRDVAGQAPEEPSMGPPPFGDGNSGQLVYVGQTSDLPSMGPPPFGDGNLARRSHATADGGTFNGATAFRRWKLSPIS